MIASQSAIRDRRVLIAAVGPMVLALGVCDWALLGRVDVACTAARLAWAAYFAAIAMVAPRLSPKGLEWATVVGAIVSAACWLVLVWQTGGSHSPYFAAMVALPLLFGVLAPDSIRSSSVATAALFGTIAVVVSLEGAPAAEAAAVSSLSFVFGGIAIAGTIFYRRLREAEVALSRDRERAVQDLAVSESRRLKAERMALVGRLSSKIAHEINNPLAFLKSNLDYLAVEHRCDQEKAIEPVIADCRIGLDRIQKIVAALDSFARMDDASHEPCGLAMLVHEATRLASLRTQPLARVHVDLPERLPPVQGNAAHLVHVFANLLLNAADSIASSKSGGGNVEIRGEQDGDRVHVFFEDDGPGVPPELRPWVFEPFFTTKEAGKGTGLGLALAREFLQRCGGTIQLEDRPGGGARFRVTLSAAERRATGSEPDRSAA